MIITFKTNRILINELNILWKCIKEIPTKRELSFNWTFEWVIFEIIDIIIGYLFSYCGLFENVIKSWEYLYRLSKIIKRINKNLSACK